MRQVPSCGLAGRPAHRRLAVEQAGLSR